MQVKICGVRDVASARACAAHGATWAGLNFATGRRRAISVEQARTLLPALGGVTPVGVFLNQPLSEVRTVAAALGLAHVQLHGDYPPAACATLDCLVLRAVHGPLEDASGYPSNVVAFVLDATEPGSGEIHDWRAVGRLAVDRPVILAGGLTPETVAEAIAIARPDGVDCASGIEEDGWPSPARIAAFCAAARRTA